MAAIADPKSKPPFLRRRWPYFVLGFLAALPAPRLGWLAIERALYGGPTTTVTLIEIDHPDDPFRLMSRSVGIQWAGTNYANERVLVTYPVRTPESSVDVKIRYADRATGAAMTAEASVPLDRRFGNCYVAVRHRPDGIDISNCLRFVPYD